MSLAETRKAQRFEDEADRYDFVADQIDSGAVTIRGADPAQVSDRVREKAERLRSGEQVFKARRSYGFGSYLADEGDEEITGDASTGTLASSAVDADEKLVPF